jgi:thiol-disulfide isomerase/thioredoxin
LLFAALLLALPAFAAMPDIGERAPRFALRDLDGERVRFPADAGSRHVALLFWASWCSYCKALMPRLAQLRTPDGELLVVYAVNFGEEGDQLETLRQLDLPFVVLPQGDSVAQSYDVQRVPAVFLVKEGRVLHRLELPPADHPAVRAAKGKKQAALLADWWSQGLRKALENTAAGE